MNSESVAKEECILKAMPGTAKHICETCHLPQATVSKLLAKLQLRNRVYHFGWEHPAGIMASMVYVRGPKPEGFIAPARPRSLQVKAKPPKLSAKPAPAPVAPRKPALPSVAEWDEECNTSELFKHDPAPRTLPKLPLLIQVWMQPVTNEVDALATAWDGPIR